MSRRTTRIVAALAMLLAAAAAGTYALDAAARSAQDVELRVVSAGSLSSRTTSSVTTLPLRADMLGVTWRGAAREIELRAQGPDGRWSSWISVDAGEDGPDPTSREGRTAARQLGRRAASAPIWVGAATKVQVRRHDGQIATQIDVVAINASGSATRLERLLSRARSSAAWVLGESAQAQALAPGIRPRSSWGAAAPRVSPELATSGVQGIVVHHTAGTNRYACSQVPALLRGIQRYHMRTQGWNDIGYNYLIDRCGGVWEGRAGGLTKPVIGAHTAGFNTGTSGIALIGTHASVQPSSQTMRTLRRMIAWRLDVAHVKPTGTMTLTARTGDKYPSGSSVSVRAVSGHRDLFPTSCPGALTYAQLDRVARDAWSIGGAKVADVRRTFTYRAPLDTLDASLQDVTVSAIASHPDMTMQVRIERISTGEVLHTAAATGVSIETTWIVDAAASVPSWDVRVVVDGVRASGQRARSASFVLDPVPADPAFVVTTPPAASVAPGGDPIDDKVQLAYTLGADYRLGAWLHDPATGAQVAVLRAPTSVGPTTTARTLTLAIPASVVDGSYELRVGLPADAARGRSMRRFALTVDRP